MDHEVLSIHELINRIANDDEYKDKVSVLPIMCGSGKSQAISAKIKECIEKKEGLLVLTDRKHRLDEYMNPEHILDHEVSDFIAHHKDDVTILYAGDDFRKSLMSMKSTPVLLATTQRYFSLDENGIEDMLTWNEGRRSLIIIDEKPELYKDVELDLEKLNMLEETLFYKLTGKAESRNTLYWFRNHIKDDLMIDLVLDNIGLRSFTYPVDSRQSLPSEMSEILAAYDSTEFNPYIGQLTEEQKQVSAIESTVSGLKKTARNVKDTLDAVLHLRYSGGIQYRYPSGSSTYGIKQGFFVSMNSRDKLMRTGTKVIILDATADITTEYDQPYIQIHDCTGYIKPDGTPYLRKVPNLHIHLVRYKGSRESLEENPEFASSLKAEIIERSGDRDACMFTYKSIAEALEKTEDSDSAPYLGNLAGRNDLQFRTYAQLGLLKKPGAWYMHRYLELHPEDKEQIIKAINPAEAAELLWKSDEFQKFMYRDMIVDIEQNVFRAPVRNPRYTEQVDYYLFFDMDRDRLLTEILKDRFERHYGSVVICDEELNDLQLVKLIGTTYNGKETSVSKIAKFLLQKSSMQEFSRKEMIAESGIGSAKDFDKCIANNKTLKAYLNSLPARKEGREKIYHKP